MAQVTEDELIAACDPGIRRTVAWLRECEFRTTDSGDGISKRNVDSNPEVLWYPHVAMTVDPRDLVTAARRLEAKLRGRGVSLPVPSEVEGVAIHASFNPADGVAIVFLQGVNDAMLFGEESDSD